MRGIADQQQARQMPAFEPVDLHCQQLDLIPVRERRSARRHERCRCRQAGAERFEALRLQRVEATLGNQIRALPVVAAIDQHQHAAAIDDAHAVRRSEEHTSELQSLMRISYAVFCLKKKKQKTKIITINTHRTRYTRTKIYN